MLLEVPNCKPDLVWNEEMAERSHKAVGERGAQTATKPVGLNLVLIQGVGGEAEVQQEGWQSPFPTQGRRWRWGREGGSAGVGWRDGEKRHTTVTE